MNPRGLETAHAVIPIKRFDLGKTRLRERLDDAARRTLARSMFEHVLEISLRCPRLDGVLVLTDAPAIAAASSAKGARVLADSKPAAHAGTGPQLARVVDTGLAELRRRGVQAALVLMADLPCLTAADLDLLLQALTDHDLVLAPDRAGRCTNALGLALPATHDLSTAFGDTDSLALHRQRAQALGLRTAVVTTPSLALDVDLPTDLDLLAGLHHD